MKDCQRELTTFLNSLELLGDRIGPLLLQFPYFNRNAFASRAQFDKLLQPFLKTLPKELQFAWRYEIKIGGFRRYRPGWIPSIDVLARALDLLCGDFFYARFIGDRKEAKTQRWDRLTEDKTSELIVWIEEFKKIAERASRAYVFSAITMRALRRTR